MQLTYMCQNNNVYMQHNYAKIRDNYVNMRLKLSCMSYAIIHNIYYKVNDYLEN